MRQHVNLCLMGDSVTRPCYIATAAMPGSPPCTPTPHPQTVTNDLHGSCAVTTQILSGGAVWHKHTPSSFGTCGHPELKVAARETVYHHVLLWNRRKYWYDKLINTAQLRWVCGTYIVHVCSYISLYSRNVLLMHIGRSLNLCVLRCISPGCIYTRDKTSATTRKTEGDAIG